MNLTQMNKTFTPRDKAILVGMWCAGEDFCIDTMDSPSFVHVHGDGHITTTWFYNWYKSLFFNQETLSFFEKSFGIFYNKKGIKRYPKNYIEKMSPLAIATWIALGGKECGALNWSNKERKHFCKIFKQKWSIELDADNLVPKREKDSINLWLLTQRYLKEFAPHLTPEFTSLYHRNNKMIYLSGGQQYSPDGGVNWRAKVGAELYIAGYDVFNPAFEGYKVHDTFGVNLSQLDLYSYIKAGKIFIEKDLAAIKASDAVLTFIDESAMKGAGTKGEACTCADYNIPNYFVFDKDIEIRKLPIWLCGCIRDIKYICEDFNDAIKKIKRVV